MPPPPCRPCCAIMIREFAAKQNGRWIICGLRRTLPRSNLPCLLCLRLTFSALALSRSMSCSTSTAPGRRTEGPRTPPPPPVRRVDGHRLGCSRQIGRAVCLRRDAGRRRAVAVCRPNRSGAKGLTLARRCIAGTPQPATRRSWSTRRRRPGRSLPAWPAPRDPIPPCRTNRDSFAPPARVAGRSSRPGRNN